MKLIGIGGLTRSGKDTLAEYLIELGYFGASFGDIVRAYARKRHAGEPDPISVANMTETANWLRHNNGADFVLKEAIKQFDKAQKRKNYKGLVLYSVRAPVEVDYIHQNNGKVVWVEASGEVRYQRARHSRRQGEATITVKEFHAHEDLQWQPKPGIPAEAQMNAKYVKENADIFIENNETDIDVFIEAAKKALGL
ncbi:MAG TPA: AAA family ATPase [Candidatus Saccharimonadales bacterium]|nr:AAA family ATPase [Candidatus Saccharimonadales bacterium]